MNNITLQLSGKANIHNYEAAMRSLCVDTVSNYPPDTDTLYDGLILCGGGDIDPEYYNEKSCGSKGIDRERDRVELSLLSSYVAAKKPVLGICRGHQLINVFFGGSLCQHLPESGLHTCTQAGDSVHGVTACADSVLKRLYGTSFCVNSSHHQGVLELGCGLLATAFWDGKYIEAIEHQSLPILGVQWHPERMCFENKRDDTVDGSLLLSYFVDLCKKYKR